MNTLQESVLNELVQAITNIPFNKILGLRLHEIEKETVSLRFAMQPDLVGNFLHGILHGGVISSVLDMAGGMIVMAGAIFKEAHFEKADLIKTISHCSTVDLQIQYLRPGKGETFTAKAYLLKSGNSISFVRMELTNQDNILLATGNGTYHLK